MSTITYVAGWGMKDLPPKDTFREAMKLFLEKLQHQIAQPEGIKAGFLEGCWMEKRFGSARRSKVRFFEEICRFSAVMGIVDENGTFIEGSVEPDAVVLEEFFTSGRIPQLN